MKNKFGYILTIIITLFIGIIATIYVTNKFNSSDSNISKTSLEVKETNSLKESISKIYDAVLLIETYDSYDRAIGSGTGFVYKKENKKGYILTNHHVVSGASKILVTLSSGEQIEAKYLGSDEVSDVAVISIDENKVLQVAELGDSTKMELGDTVFTVGSPLGSKYMGSVTKGIVSGKDRQVTVQVSNGNVLVDVLQTDAAINPGNSGGPLVNINGEVIGITSLKLVQDEIEGMGFALPIEYAFAYTKRLEKGEAIERPVLGVQLSDLNNAYVLRSYRINLSSNVKKGVVLIGIDENGTAKEAGLEVGDVITKINNGDVTDSASFRYNLYKYSIGDTIEITYIRENKVLKTKVKLIDKIN